MPLLEEHGGPRPPPTARREELQGGGGGEGGAGLRPGHHPRQGGRALGEEGLIGG